MRTSALALFAGFAAFGYYAGIGVCILCICYGCSHCDRTEAEIKLIEAQTKAVQKAANPQ